MNIPQLGFGLGLRAPHFQQFIDETPAGVSWLEIISDNYLNAHKGTLDTLAKIRETYPLVMHGVSLSIGSTDPLDENYLAGLKTLASNLEPAWISDHICYTGVRGRYTHDLLPIPYTEEALAHLVPRIHHAQEILQRPFVFENASTYFEWDGSSIPEAEFITELHRATGCGVLLDINNVYVSSQNHGLDARASIDAIPAEAIIQYHLAGHTDCGTHLVDTHDAPVTMDVWELYQYAIQAKGMRSTMVEWDAAIPPLETLMDEVRRARFIANVAKGGV